MIWNLFKLLLIEVNHWLLIEKQNIWNSFLTGLEYEMPHSLFLHQNKIILLYSKILAYHFIHNSTAYFNHNFLGKLKQVLPFYKSPPIIEFFQLK